jgi:hypothetical protein
MEFLLFSLSLMILGVFAITAGKLGVHPRDLKDSPHRPRYPSEMSLS